MTQNGQFCPMCNFSNLFPLKWLRMTRNGQFCLICNFSNLFPLKWLRMTQNGQFCMAKIKYTLIQGNFYERLLFYMDSCVLSPMASLLVLTWSSTIILNILDGIVGWCLVSCLNFCAEGDSVLRRAHGIQNSRYSCTCFERSSIIYQNIAVNGR